MKNLKSSWYFLIVLFTVFTFHSCQEAEDPIPEEKVYTHFVSDEWKSDVSSQEIKFKLGLAQSAYPAVSPFLAEVKSGIDVHKITYNTSFQDLDIQASGLVYLPKVAGNYPVLCFQNGTNTLRSQAPSEMDDNEMSLMLESVASMGFIVVVPDYIGFGASSNKPHPYLHAQSTTQSILDMLRAMKEFSTEEEILAKPTKDLFIYGYSQGGWATMLLQKEIETSYATEFNLIASSCAAGPYSLEYMNNYIIGQTSYPMPYFLAYLLNAYTSIGLVTNPLSDFINAPYAAKIPGLYDGLQSGTTINAALTTSMVDLLTSDYRNQFATDPKFSVIKTALIANSIVPWAMKTPTRLYHGSKDVLIPSGMSVETIANMKAAGTSESKIQLILLPDAGHTDGVVPVGILTILWFLELKK